MSYHDLRTTPSNSTTNTQTLIFLFTTNTFPQSTTMPPSDPGLPPPQGSPSFWLNPIDPFLKSHRTTPELPSAADIVIIGSGISGTMSALYIYDHFMRAGGKMPKVVMLESREVCFGATGRVSCVLCVGEEGADENRMEAIASRRITRTRTFRR